MLLAGRRKFLLKVALVDSLHLLFLVADVFGDAEIEVCLGVHKLELCTSFVLDTLQAVVNKLSFIEGGSLIFLVASRHK